MYSEAAESEYFETKTKNNFFSAKPEITISKLAGKIKNVERLKARNFSLLLSVIKKFIGTQNFKRNIKLKSQQQLCHYVRASSNPNAGDKQPRTRPVFGRETDWEKTPGGCWHGSEYRFCEEVSGKWQYSSLLVQ